MIPDSRLLLSPAHKYQAMCFMVRFMMVQIEHLTLIIDVQILTDLYYWKTNNNVIMMLLLTIQAL